MNLRQMEIFLRVTECESFLEAANSLFMSQSAVSQQIIRMEKELGFSSHAYHMAEKLDKIYATGSMLQTMLEDGE